jgi:hypothetical protein
MKEVFKTIPSFSDYEVSNCGRVRTLSRPIRYLHAVTGKEHFRISEHRFLKVHYNNRTGYNFCQLYKDKKMYNKTIHSLVADVFLIKGDDHDTVNHIDGNKLNNLVENLEWCTNLYNHEHASKNGLKAKGSKIGTSKLNERCVLAIKNLIEEGFSDGKIAKWFNVSRSTILMVRRCKTWNFALTGQELTIK